MSDFILLLKVIKKIGSITHIISDEKNALRIAAIQEFLSNSVCISLTVVRIDNATIMAMKVSYKKLL